MGLEDIMSAGEEVLIVEWADRAADIFPEHALWIDLDYDPREIRADANPAACEVVPDEDGSVPSRHRIAIGNAPQRYAGLVARLAAAFTAAAGGQA